MKVKVKLRRTTRKGNKKVVDYHVVTTDFAGSWLKDADHKAFREAIRKKYSGMSIVVYSPVK